MAPALSLIALTAMLAQAQQDCSGVLDATQLRILPVYSSYDLPEGDRAPYPAAEVTTICRIGDFGRFVDCVSSPRDPRNDWLNTSLFSWKVRESSFDGCPLAGRQVRLRVRFLADDGGVSFHKGARWEDPLYP